MQINGNGKTALVFANLTDNIIRFRWIWLIGVLLVTAFFLTQFKKIRFDNSQDIWFIEGHESLKNKAMFNELFGNDDYVAIFFHDEKGFDPQTLATLSKLTDKLEQNVPYLNKITWLGNAEYIESTDEGIEINEFLDPVPTDPKLIEKALDRALEEPSYINSIIAPDTKTLAILMEMELYPEDRVDPKKEIPPVVYSILAEDDFKSVKGYSVGSPVFSYEYDRMVQKEGGVYFICTLVIQAILLFWLGRGLRGVLVPLITMVLGVIWAMGSMGALGITMNLLSMALPTILICVGIGDSMHIIAGFQDHVDGGTTRKQGLRGAMALSGKAIMLTSLTTAAGFLAFLATHVQPYREMGIYVAIGVIFTFILSIILVPLFYSFGKEYPKKRTSAGGKTRRDFFDRLLASIHNLDIKRPKLIVSVFLLITAVSIFGLLKLEIESDTIKLLSKSCELRQALDIVDEKMGGAMYAEIILDTGKPDGIKDPDFLKKVDLLEEHVKKHPLTTSTQSVLEILKKMRKALHGNDMAYYTVPDTREAASQYLFMYETSGGDTMDRLVSFDSSVIRVNAKTKVLTTKTCRGYQDYILDYAHELFDGTAEIKMSGGLYRYMSLNDILSEGQKSSFAAALIAISIIMVLLMRSVKLGAISMIPNIFPVMITLGTMGLAGQYLDVITMSFSAVIIGVAVDDTIHFFTRYRNEFNLRGNYAEALKHTLGTVGRPITFTTLTLSLGFAPFIFSSLLGYQKLGMLMGFSFTWALLADLFFAPALVMLTKPLGPEPNPSNKEA